MRTRGEVLVVYEDAAARTNAVRFCDSMVERFWCDCQFEIIWFSFDELQEPERARTATQHAGKAGVVVFSLRSQTEIPLVIRRWVEGWSQQRHEAEGILAGLVEGDQPDKHAYLRDVAHRANMDYLTGVPQSISRTIPDSLDSYSARADHVTSVLDEILQQRPPTHPILTRTPWSP